MILTRKTIHIQTIKGWQRQGDHWDWMIDPANDIAYIRMTSFTQDTPDELHQALSEIDKAGGRGLILDLRFNPGGYLKAAISVADEFLRQGRIVSTKGRQQPESASDATKDGAFQDGQLVVLVNDFSASAAEIVSGALKDWHRATIVGTRSFGKGSVQNLIPIRNDRAYLKLTTAYYYLPNGTCLHRTPDSKTWGVEPDVKVPMTPEQMRKWLEAAPPDGDHPPDRLLRADQGDGRPAPRRHPARRGHAADAHAPAGTGPDRRRVAAGRGVAIRLSAA